MLEARSLFVATALGVLLLAPQARAQVTIDFESLPSGTVLTNQYPEVTFSTTTGNANFVYGFAGGKILCTGPSTGTITCVEDTYMDFTMPVKSLTFWAIEPNCACVDAQFRIYENGVLTATVDLIGLGGSGNKFVDLSAFNNVTRLEIVNILNSTTLENGIGWDDFSFAPACGNPTTYCTAKVNSAGCVPTIAASGIASASAGSGFTISTSNLLDNKFGSFFYSKSGPSSIAFKGGLICGQPPLVRTMLQNSGGSGACGGSFQIDFNAYVASGKDPALVAGQQVWAQSWSRDPGFAPPDNFSFSDAVTFTLCP